MLKAGIKHMREGARSFYPIGEQLDKNVRKYVT